jgi:class 3 adenylate cyclase
MPPVRRLTAILAADVAGYSRLMGADEEGTHERLKAHLEELVNPKIAEHRGRIVKNTGDGFLAEFASVVDGVRCGVEVQRGMVERNAATPVQQRIEFRMGINLGDVIAEGEDIFGDGVNIAARLEALADPGGICVSRVVRDQVRDRVDYTFEDRGTRISLWSWTRPQIRRSRRLGCGSSASSTTDGRRNPTRRPTGFASYTRAYWPSAGPTERGGSARSVSKTSSWSVPITCKLTYCEPACPRGLRWARSIDFRARKRRSC